MFKNILFIIIGFIFALFLASDYSPFDEIWNSNALFITKLLFNPIFFAIILMFILMAWCALSYVIALLVKGDNHISYVYSDIVFPFRRKNGVK